jgi:uncharacterized protein
VLVTALASGGAWRGVSTMLAFGFGTLPALLFASLFLRQPRRLQQVRVVRTVFGVMITGLGLLGLMHAMHNGVA